LLLVIGPPSKFPVAIAEKVTLLPTEPLRVQYQLKNLVSEPIRVVVPAGGPITSNNAFDKVTVQKDDSGSGETIILQEDLYSKPEIFAILPGPFGDDGPSDNQGLWGVNVANPTDGVMNVYKAVFTLLDPEGGGGFKMFKTDCPLTNISPWGANWNFNDGSFDGDWRCVLENQLRWKNNTNPIQIPARSTYSFLVRVETGGISGGGGRDLESMPVHITLVTSSGQFGKAGYDSSLDNDRDVYANVFLGNGLGTVASNNMNSTRTGVLNNTLTTFNIWLADLDASPTTSIKGQNSGESTSLIINLPQGWTLPGGTPANNATWDFSYTPFPDTSSQLVGTLKPDLGDVATEEGAKITFTARAPIVSETKLYVFYILANGVTHLDFTVSPLMEMVVQVCGTPACT